MKNLTLILFVSIILSACTKNNRVSAIEAETSTNSMSASNTVVTEVKDNKPIKNEYIDIYIGQEIPLKKLNDLKQTLNKPLKKVGEAGECGNFFDDEIVYQLGNLGVSANKTKAVISDVIGIPDNFRIHYHGLIIQKGYQPNHIDKSKFEVTSDKADNEQHTFGINDKTHQYEYHIGYTIREKTDDELLNLYYLNNSLIGIKTGLQC